MLAKDEAQQDRLAEVLYNLTESITIGASLLHSFLPETAEKIVAQLNTTLREFDDLDKFGLYESGTKVTACKGGGILLQDEQICRQTHRLYQHTP